MAARVRTERPLDDVDDGDDDLVRAVEDRLRDPLRDRPPPVDTLGRRIEIVDDRRARLVPFDDDA